MSFFKLNVPFLVVCSLMFLGGHVIPAEMRCTFRIFLTEHVHRPITDAINAAPLCFQGNVEVKTHHEEAAQQATAERGGLSSMLACRLHPAQGWRRRSLQDSDPPAPQMATMERRSSSHHHRHHFYL